MTSDWSSVLDLLVDLDRAAGLREGIERALWDAMRDGRLAVGTTLPSSRSLARDLGVARGTVSAAYRQLARRGLPGAAAESAGAGALGAAAPAAVPRVPGSGPSGGLPIPASAAACRPPVPGSSV